jgi:outer membrane protein OmpA-like peptidoglycan-associated protein/Tol biopolymer transport system component
MIKKIFLLIGVVLSLPNLASAQVKRLLPGAVNTVKFTEYAPSLSADGQTLVYETDRAAGKGGWELYQADLLQNGSWSIPKALSSINSFGNGKDLIGGPSISYDGNTLFYFAFLEDSPVKSYGREDIYYSVREKNGWSKPINLGSVVNTPGYEGFPSISADGKRLYFMQSTDDGTVNKEYACYKIMMSERGRDGNWKRAIELPAPINVGCEKAPRIMADNRTLMFSSVRKGGKGDFDVYKSVLQDNGSWSEPVNLSFINTKGLDQFVSIPPCGDMMYFTSGGDIYTVPVPEDLRPRQMAAVQGFVTDSLTGRPVVAKVVALNEEGKKTISEMDNNASDGRYTVILETGKEYTLQILAPGYYRKTVALPTGALNQCGTLTQNIQLIPPPRSESPLVASTAPKLIVVDAPLVAPHEEVTVKKEAGKAIVTLEAFDKQTQKPLAAVFQIVGSKTGRKLNLATTPQRLSLTLTFTESDNLMIKVMSEGYVDVSEPLKIAVESTGDTRYNYQAFLPSLLGSTLTINVVDAEIRQPVPGLKIVLQDETAGTSEVLSYDLTTMKARALVDPTHRYTVDIDAPGYTPYRKYIAKLETENEIGVQLPKKVRSRLLLAGLDQRTGEPITARFRITIKGSTQGEVINVPAGTESTYVFDGSGTYVVEVTAEGYRPFSKEFVVAANEPPEATDFKPRLEPALTEYTILVIDKEQNSVIPEPIVKILDQEKKALKVSSTTGNEFTVWLPDTGEFTYEVSAAKYNSVKEILARSPSRIVQVLLTKQEDLTRTVAFMAQDVFTKENIGGRFRLMDYPLTTTGSSPTATVTTAGYPEFGTELKMKQTYTLEVNAEGYNGYSKQFTLTEKEAESVAVRIIALQPQSYQVGFTVLDAVTMQAITASVFQVREEGQIIPVRAEGAISQVRLKPGLRYEVRVESSGYEPFERTLAFDVPQSLQDLKKSVLLTPVVKVVTPVPTATTTIEAPKPPIKVIVETKDDSVFADLKVGVAVRLDNVYFDQSSYILRPESYPQLDKLVKTLKLNRRLKIEIGGHTDNVGKARLNQYLSENRAKVISSYLTNNGILENRLVWKGYGQTKPVAVNDTEGNKAQNRRVEFIVLEN